MTAVYSPYISTSFSSLDGALQILRSPMSPIDGTLVHVDGILVHGALEILQSLMSPMDGVLVHVEINNFLRDQLFENKNL